jgi:hypothetical protein
MITTTIRSSIRVKPLRFIPPPEELLGAVGCRSLRCVTGLLQGNPYAMVTENRLRRCAITT